MRAAKAPCANCPFRRDAPPGEFAPERYEALRATAGCPGAEVGLQAPIFACHKSADGKEIACAGWLARVGYEHLGIRYAVVTGQLDPAQLDVGPDWPELYATYEKMVEAQDG